MARKEIREVVAIGTAIVPGVVCVGEFAQFYGEIAGNDNLPKKVSRKARRRKTKKAQTNKQMTSAVVPVHSEPDQVCIGIHCPCKGRFREMSKKEKSSTRQPSFKGIERNWRRKPGAQLTA